MKDEDNPASSGSETGSSDAGSEIARFFSVLVALIGLAIAYWSPDAGTFHVTLALVVLPLGCIWYGREIGGFTADAQDDNHNPVGTLITYIGWTLLFAMIAVLLWLSGQYETLLS